MEFRRVQVTRRKWCFRIVLTEKEEEYFMNNFRGCLLFRGSGSASYKRFDRVLWYIKQSLRKNPFLVLKEVSLRLVPNISYSEKRFGKRFVAIPTIAYGNKRFVVMMDWIVRKQKGKTNIRGVNIREISNLISNVDLKKRGRTSLLALKKAYVKKALSGRYHLRRMRRPRKKVQFKKKNQLFNVEKYVQNVIR